jgi:hypothetical protein
MVEKLHKIGELDQCCLPIRPERCVTTSENSDNDQTEKLPLEIIDKQVFTSCSDSNITTDLFVLPNRLPIFLVNLLVYHLFGIYIESICRIVMILASLYQVK